jgi:hypothetical protein
LQSAADIVHQVQFVFDVVAASDIVAATVASLVSGNVFSVVVVLVLFHMVDC